MAQAQETELSPEIVLEEMKKNGVTHVVWLPDSETNWLYLLMQAEPSLRLVPVSREGLAFSMAAGVSVGGKNSYHPHPKYRLDGIRRLSPRLGTGPEYSYGVNGWVPGMDPSRHHPGYRRYIH